MHLLLICLKLPQCLSRIEIAGDVCSSITRIVVCCRKYQRWQSAAIPSVCAAGNRKTTETPVPTATFAQRGIPLHMFLPDCSLSCTICLLPFSPFTTVSLCGIEGIADTFPFALSVAHSYLISQAFMGLSLLTVSYLNMGLPLGRFPTIISTIARMFSGLLFTRPNHSNHLLFMIITIGSTFASSKIFSFLFCPLFAVDKLHLNS